MFNNKLKNFVTDFDVMVAKKVSAKSAAEEEGPAMATPSDSPSSSTNNDWFKVKVNFKNPDFKVRGSHNVCAFACT